MTPPSRTSRSAGNPKNQADFNQQVYAIVRSIPQGRVMTYGGIAALIPPPAGMDPGDYAVVRARWVGYAMAACPPDVPWHRVVNARGGISLREGHGPHVQRQWLEEEGVAFNSKDLIDLSVYGWQPEGPPA